MQYLRKILVYIFPIFLFVSISAQGQDTARYRKIEDSLDSKPLLLSKFFENELKLFPQNTAILQRLGRSYLLSDSFAKAEKTLQSLLALDPKCGFCYLGFSHIAMKKHNLSKAMEYINKAIEIADNNETYYLYRAQLFLAQNNVNAAEDDFNKAIKIDPNAYGSYYSRALFYKENNSLLSAIADLEKSIQLNPIFDEGIQAICYLYKQTDQVKKALPIVNNAIRLSPDKINYYQTRAQIYLDLEDWSNALTDLNFLKEQGSQDYNLFQYIGLVKYQLEDMDGACASYATAIELLKESKDLAIAEKADIVATMNDFCDSTKASYYYQRGIAAFNHGKYKEAIEAHEVGLKKFPNNSMMQSFKANALLRLGAYQDAIHYYQLSNTNIGNYIDELNLSSKYKKYTAKEKELLVIASHAMNFYNISEAYFFLDAAPQALLYVDSAILLYAKAMNIEKELNLLEMFQYHKAKVLINNNRFDESIVLFNQILKDNPEEQEPKLFKAIAIISKELGKPQMVRSYSIGIQQQQQTIMNWNSTKKVSKNINTTVINNAITLCNEVIKKMPDYAFAYYIRGQIKWQTDQPDFCYDLIKAKQLDANLDIRFMSDCQ